jgi:hypothetical protein
VLVKLVFFERKDRTLLGVHVLGDLAPELAAYDGLQRLQAR